MKFLTLLFMIFLVTGCTQEWQGYVYPDKNDLTKHIQLGNFDSLENCRKAAIDVMWKLGERSKRDYECGLNCKTETMPMICEKTVGNEK
jgi:hypothetical protein